jgi:3-oxosteroid 1-dehydrogenase
MFSWGGMSSKTHWDWDLMRERRAELQLTFGTGIVAPFFEAVLARSIDLRLGHRVTSLVREGSGFTVVADGPDGPVSMSAGSAILATGAHDWSGALMRTHTGIVPEHGGSLAPTSLMGDVFSLTSPLGGEAAALPPWAAPVLPGYRLPMPAFEGDAGFRACYEHCLPHTVIVNSDGERFTDDSFHSKIVAHVLGDEGEARFPIFMVWDSQHHQKYGLGTTMPGGQYPDGLVARGSSLQELAESLGVDAANLVQTVDRYNAGARLGRDDEFGRGSNMSVRLFRGDRNQEPNACIGPIEEGPYYGMQLRLLSTGIAAAGVVTGPSGQVLDADREPIDGLYAVGECAARAAAGVGYNSGYSLSRAMAFGHLAAKRIAATT